MASVEQSAKQTWLRRGKLTFYGLLVAGIGFLVGLYIIAPMQAKSESFVPNSVEQMEKITVQFKNNNGTTVPLVVNHADTEKEREQGLNNVGREALMNTYLLYDQGDVISWGEDYEVEKINAPLTLGVMNGEGKIIDIKTAKLSDEEVSVEADHRMVLAMKQGLFEKFGIENGSILTKDSLEKFTN